MEFGPSCASGMILDGPVLATLATGLGLVMLIIWVLRRESFPGRALFVGTIAGMAWWLMGASLEMAVPTLGCKLAAAVLTWPAIALVPVTWMLFHLRLCLGLGPWRRPVTLIIVASTVVPVLLMVLSNPWHGLFYGPLTRVDIVDGRPSGVFDHGPLFYLTLGVLSLYMLASLGIAGIAAFSTARAARATRPLMLLLLTVSAVPFLTNLGYSLFGVTLFGFDPTPYTFALALVMLAWSMYGNRSFDLAAIARDVLFFNTSDPVLVSNSSGEMIGLNPAADRIFHDLNAKAAPDILSQIEPDITWVLGSGLPKKRKNVRLGNRVFDLRTLPIWHPLAARHAAMGAVIVMTDVTDVRAHADRLEATQARLHEQLATVNRLRVAAEQAALLDPLTMLGNRRSLQQRFKALEGKPLLLLVMDIDHFKTINDRFGHQAGDRVLCHFARIVEETLPREISLFRTGGEEFELLCPDFDEAQIVKLLKKITAKLAQDPDLRSSDRSTVTFSAGIARRPDDGITLIALERAADARLYQAKRNGRARSVGRDGSQQVLSPMAIGNVIRLHSDTYANNAAGMSESRTERDA